MRVGEKEISEQAEIVRRYADLFSRDQLDALREAEERERGDERELLYRLRKTCEGGLISARARRARGRAREPPARGARDVPGRGDAAAQRAGAARRAAGLRATARSSARSRPRPARASTPTGSSCCARARSWRPSYSGIADAVERNEEEKGISLRELSRALKRGERRLAPRRTSALRDRWFARLLGAEREDVPSSYHTAYMRRLSPLESTYTKERATEICLADARPTLGFDLAAQTNIKLDLDDRPQKSPRACVIASDPPRSCT